MDLFKFGSTLFLSFFLFWGTSFSSESHQTCTHRYSLLETISHPLLDAFKALENPHVSLYEIERLKILIKSKRDFLAHRAKLNFDNGLQGAAQLLSHPSEQGVSVSVLYETAQELLLEKRILEELPDKIGYIEARQKEKQLIQTQVVKLSKQKILPHFTQNTPPKTKSDIEKKLKLVPELIPYPKSNAHGIPSVTEANDRTWHLRKRSAASSHLEAEVANHLDQKWGDVLSFNETFNDSVTKKLICEIDIRMGKAFVEVTGARGAKLKQITEIYFSDLVNPNHLPVILYAPHYSYYGGAVLMNEALSKKLPVLVVQSHEELDDALKLIYRK